MRDQIIIDQEQRKDGYDPMSEQPLRWDQPTISFMQRPNMYLRGRKIVAHEILAYIEIPVSLEIPFSPLSWLQEYRQLA